MKLHDIDSTYLHSSKQNIAYLENHHSPGYTATAGEDKDPTQLLESGIPRCAQQHRGKQGSPSSPEA
ncbi:hypothetical protein DL767_000481 [Monosporascus sp. MG133]|nr:hypothetical protein DL767_000481 [Monosporascus sp. MG133]